MTSTQSESAPVAAPRTSDSKFIGPCVVAALIWLMLALYMFYVVPAQLNLHDQTLKPEQLRMLLPVPLRAALFFQKNYGTAVVSVLGMIGCGIAYAKRSTKLANGMIIFGALILGWLIWAVLANAERI